MDNYLPKNALIPGERYHVDGRNFSTATWDGEKFIGTRFKFGHRFEDYEYHYDDGPPYGTVKPICRIE